MQGSRIVHVVEAAKGGVSTYLRELMAYQRASGAFEEVVLLAERSRFDPYLEGVADRTVLYDGGRGPAGVLRGVREVGRALRALGPCVVMAHSTFPGLFVRLGAYRAPGVAAIVYCAHGWAFCREASGLQRAAYVALERWLGGRTDLTIHISHFDRRAALSAGVRARRDVVIYHGVRDARPAQGRTPDLGDDRINVGFVGRFDRQKGADLLLAAARSERLAHLRFWFVGSNVLDAGDASGAEGPPSGVEFTGWVGQDEIDAYFAAFDVVVMPSRWEGFGLVALEAMRNGCPVIVSDRGALPELVVDGYNGLVVSLDDPNDLERTLRGLDRATLRGMRGPARQVYEARFQLDPWLRRTQMELGRIGRAPSVSPPRRG